SESVAGGETPGQALADRRRASEPCRQGQRHDRAGDQQASEDAPGNGDRDEAAEEDGRTRQARGDVQQRWAGRRARRDRPSRRAFFWRSAGAGRGRRSTSRARRRIAVQPASWLRQVFKEIIEHTERKIENGS